MYQIKKEVKWEAAHRLCHYEGKCSNIHGHSYRAIFTLEQDIIGGKSGMVMDFALVKKMIQGYLDAHWDHALILNEEDSLCNLLKDTSEIPITKMFFMKSGEPTAENMAKYLFEFFFESFFAYAVILVSVEVFEGATSSAIYKL